ncbi:SDR family oxidoreductase [Streptomyces carpaticus]|uniref:SDR family oxidoreductase n=1 Tax=Streptomyces carpaticus TaxID=285558 RepID=UPI0031F72B45
MRVFVTGGSGWIGSALVPELLRAGHDVVGLARSDASAAALTSAGAEVVRGTLDDLDTLRETAAASDGVVHLAFKHDIAFTGNFEAAAAADRLAAEAIGSALEGTGRPFVLTAGTPVEPGRPATERDGHDVEVDAADLDEGPQARAATAEWVLSLASRGVRSSVMRLPRTNHGEGDTGFVAGLVGIARDKGMAGYVGDGAFRWPAIHRLDTAHLFRLAVEQAPAGATLHAVAEEGVPLREVAEVIGRHLDVPVVSVDPADAAGHFGWLGPVVSVDQPASSALTRELMEWRPTRPGLLADLDEGHYFRAG